MKSAKPKTASKPAPAPKITKPPMRTGKKGGKC